MVDRSLRREAEAAAMNVPTFRVIPWAAALLLAVPSGLLPGSTPSAAATPSVIASAVAANQAPASTANLAVRPDGSKFVVYRGQDDAVYKRTWTTAGWSAQSTLGGGIVGAPAVAAYGADLIVAARGTNGSMWTRTRTGGAWQPWRNMGGQLSASPAICASPDGRIDAFVRGPDNQLYQMTRLPGQAWSRWQALGGTLTTGPAAVAYGSSRVDVFIVGTDHAVARRTSTAAGWSAWTSLGGVTYTAPAAARIPGASSARVFVRGTNSDLYVNEGAGWRTIGGDLVDAPAAAGTPSGADVLVRAPNAALYARRLSGATWSAFTQVWTPAAPAAPASSLLRVDWTRLPTSAKVVALTFDAGANADALPAIRATLQRENVPATFFLTGAWTRSFPAQANEIAVAGFRVGNHTDTHPNLPDLSDAAVRTQVTTAERAIFQANGANPRPLFRFPYGDVNSRVLADVNGLGYVAVRWTVDSLGWQGTSGGMTSLKVVNRVLAAAQPGVIVLMHVGSHPTDGSTLDADALQRVIDGFQARGYGFVTLKALTG
jgi:peptidoglycan/xylan/chitin deacetylase (PgdA/CDA1 family)